MTDPHPLVARRDAAQAVIDAYDGKPFVWGQWDCARLAALDLKLLGHKVGLARFGYYRSARSAAKALKSQGCADLADAMDALGFPRIAPAFRLPGDIIGFGHPDMPTRVALTVAVSNGRVFGFHEDTGAACVMEPHFLVASVDYMAWRVDPCPR